jgi:hypothetical protein
VASDRSTQAQPLGLFAGCVFIVIGLALLLDNWGTISLHPSNLVPLLIVAGGIGIIALALSRVVPGLRRGA